MPGPLIRDIVIVGGGTAGWMTAAALSNHFGRACSIRLVESDEIGIIGVGEATIPHIVAFNRILGIDEDEFLRATRGTFKLGIEFVNWSAIGDRYTHGFGKLGPDLDGLPFHHFWLRGVHAGLAAGLGDYSINTAAPRRAKFMRPRPDMAGSPLQRNHVRLPLRRRTVRPIPAPAGRAKRRRAHRRQDRRACSSASRMDSSAPSCWSDGRRVEGGLFVDCSGMHGVLIEKTLHTGYEDWSHWLPCDRAVAVPCRSVEPLIPMTRATAHGAGWQWRIPLQHRIGNGHVYSSRFMSQEDATAILMGNLDGEPLAEPRHIPFTPGRRKRVWNRNCIALGLAAGFFEPIESTNIHLIQTAISRLMTLFPRGGFDQADIDEVNTQARIEYERVRDFIVLHYKATERDDTPFWQYCRTMEIPATLQHKIDLYRSNGRFFREDNELFGELSWVQVMEGQRIRASGYHPFADLRPIDEVRAFLADTQRVISACVEAMPTHAEFIAQHCAFA